MKLPKSYYNTVSLAGSVTAIISLLLIVLVISISYFFDEGSSYLGLFAYILLPMILFFGLLLIPIGMYLAIRRSKKQNQPLVGQWKVIDFNNPQYRNAASLFTIVTIIFLLLSAIGSYEAFHYTESNEFCGTLCHKVMEPEYTTYQHSSHAKVKCVECHVGEGANWYVKSKLSGLYQVYSVLASKYPRPIATPIKNLRPARETCLECHWPEKFYTTRLKYEQHFLADSLNTEWNIQLKMKTGGHHSSTNLQEGIHWHINPNVKIEYISSSPSNEEIPWVRYIDLQTNDTIIYEDTWMPLEEEDIVNSTPRTMDCMDCHNRPSHNYLQPSQFVDKSISSGEIPQLPHIKYVAMELLRDPYSSLDTALYNIDQTIRLYYQENYPNLSDSMVIQAIEGISKGYRKNIFPQMQASWDVYPDHIGHKVFNGCFRCHSNNHESTSGLKITGDCDACHNILLQGTPGQLQTATINESLPFKHPMDIDEIWKESLCTDCHRYLYP